MRAAACRPCARNALMRVARTIADVAHSLRIAPGPGGSDAGARGGDGGAPLRAQSGGLASPS
eukprot:9764120-Heterocapsa_arctica.AAC.1